jgi:hypothetical protein
LNPYPEWFWANRDLLSHIFSSIAFSVGYIGAKKNYAQYAIPQYPNTSSNISKTQKNLSRLVTFSFLMRTTLK